MINENSIITTKDERQALGVHRFSSAGYSGILNYVPRFGKTLTAIKCAVATLKQSSKQNILIVVINDLQVNQWVSALHNYNISCVYEEKIDDFYITTISKLTTGHVNADIDYALIVYDEIHKYLTEDRLKVLTSPHVRSNHKLGLTGSMPNEEKKDLLTDILSVVDVIEEDEAIRNKWISNYVEYNYGINFNSTEEKSYTIYTSHITTVIQNFTGHANKLLQYNFSKEFDDITYGFQLKFKSDYTLILACAKGYYNVDIKQFINADAVCKMVAFTKGFNRTLTPDNDYNKMIIDNWAPDKIKASCSKFKSYVEHRNTLMTDSLNKLYATVDVVSKFKDRTCIIFMGSIKSADLLTSMLNSKYGNSFAACYHSKIESRFLLDNNGNYRTFQNGKPKKFGKTSLKKFAVRGLKDGSIKVLVTVNSLDEGRDIPNINLAITTFGSTNPIQHTQRTSRAKTINPEIIDEKVTVINIYFDDYDVDDKTIVSRDKTKLFQRQRKNDSRTIKINSLDAIIF